MPTRRPLPRHTGRRHQNDPHRGLHTQTSIQHATGASVYRYHTYIYVTDRARARSHGVFVANLGASNGFTGTRLQLHALGAI